MKTYITSLTITAAAIMTYVSITSIIGSEVEFEANSQYTTHYEQAIKTLDKVLLRVEENTKELGCITVSVNNINKKGN